MVLSYSAFGQIGAAMNFDGVNDQVRVPGSTMGAFTIEFWMRTTQTGPIATNWNDGIGLVDSEVTGTLNNDYGVTLMGSKVAFGIGNPAVTITSTTNVNSGGWVHVAAMFTSNPNGRMWLYINGILEAFQDPGVSNNARNTNADLTIGSIQTNVRYFNGDIDEVRLWNYTLSQCEILNRMNCELALPQSGLLRYFKFNEGVAGGNNTAITTVTNSVGGTGTISNMALNGVISNLIAPGAVASGISCNPLSVNVQGNGNNIVDGATSTSTLNGTNFNTLCSNATPITNSYLIQNNGTSVLSLNSFSIAGANANSFSITSTTPSTIGVGNSASINIQFTPTTIGTKTATVLFNTSDCAFSTYNFLLSSTVIGSPTVSVNSGSICSGSSFIINPTGASSYTFSSGTATVSPTVTTNYTVIGTDANGCFNSNTAVSTVSVTTTPTISLTSNAICVGQSYTLSPSGASTYTFSSGSAVVSPTTTTSYTVTGANASCISTNTVVATITVNSLPTASISVSKSVFCAGDSALFSTTLQSGETVQWFRNGMLQFGQTSITYSVTLNGSYRAVVTNSNGCSAPSNTINITVNNLPTATISSSSVNFCPGVTSITLTANSISGATYQWLLNSNPISGAIGQNYTANTAGQYQVVITNTNNCNSTSAISNLQNATVQTFTISAPTTSFCSGTSQTLNSNLESGSSYAWNRNGSAFGSSAVNQNTINTSSDGSYFVSVTNSFGCTATSNTLNLTVLALPTASISTSQLSICSGDSTLITAVSVPGATYEWYRNNLLLGTALVGNNNIYAKTIGAYKVTVNDGCSKTSNTITISQANITATTGAISGFIDFCAGDINTYTVPNVSGATSYSWSVSPSNAASINAGQGTNSVTINTTNQNFVLSVTPSNSCGSGTTSTFNVNINTSFGVCDGEVLFAANKTNICVNSSVIFTNYTNPNLYGGLTPVWNFGIGASPATASGNGPHNITYSSTGLKTVKLEYVDVFNNVFGNLTKSNYINVSGTINTSSITGSQSISCISNGLIYQVNNTLGSTYNWTVPSGATIVSGQGTHSIVVNFNGTAGNITVQETNGTGCVGNIVSLNVSCISTDISELHKKNDLIVYPNPASEFIIFKATNVGNIFLFDSNGKLVFDMHLENEEFVLSTNNFSSGIYFVKFISERNSNVYKIVVKR